jgi:hypothetical protein
MNPNESRAVERAGARQRAHRPSAGVGQQRMLHAVLGDRPGADQPVLRLEIDPDVGRDVVGDERRNADAEIDQHAVAQLLRDALGDDRCGVHGGYSCATR